MMMKSAKKSKPAIAAEVNPIMVQACHTGIKVLKYFSDPMSRKRAADPTSKITRATKTLTIMPVIRSFWRRFLRAVSVSCIYSLRMDFISLSTA
jgi:hypothetical protein